MIILMTALILNTSVIQLKDVTFNHSAHQTERVGKCFVCHEPSANPNEEFKTGKIKGFGKDWAHTNCIGCHDLFSEGPIQCKDCHSKSKL